ncbi:MAG: type II toxin-antitoxin system Phd/YefM family antitoxin [Acidimicrobiia bacterium]|nr:type II toxin-antitoxin system Phd/YefM family antitoxin [Acidimicrobiia bacterium]MYC58058.1 type II toxin-antitoxin system Phd/YefM family antitoxin [Acidimicrobiia bacterium]MYG93797.1 type II toxin-antitoxin system Phd/YefM family antitoxin [Acidimicrobiia bacterium]MYI30769.1 type II toxin-antitoxin system Phd/YefM family antitoxin [Acidimicrobiia bacterium]
MSTSEWTVPATQFRDKCLKLLDVVMATGDTLVVTKHGRPVAAVVPFVERPRESVIGWADDMVLESDLTRSAIPSEHWHVVADPDQILAEVIADEQG